MNTILVTGSNGQLGNELKQVAAVLTNANFIFHDIDTLDITDYSAILQLFNATKPNFIVNCAAYTAVDKAESEVEKAYLINDTAVRNIAEASKQLNTKIIHISTDYVFDGSKSTPYIETDVVNPVSAYGKTKLAGEQHLLHNPDALIIRTSWLYSSFGNNFAKTMIRLGKERNELKVVFDQVGTPTYAGDLAGAIIEIIKTCMNNSNAFKPGIYHYSNEGVCSWFDFAREIMEQCNIACNILPITTKEYPTPAKRPEYSVFNKNKIKQAYNINIPWWKDSLKICLKKLVNN